MKTDKTLIAVVGPTAIGKTALSIQLARQFATEIISADSRQFYKEMKVGTAVPTTQELALASHHFIQHISVDQAYSVGDFEKQALLRIERLFQDNNKVIMVGGSGLFVNAIIRGLDYFPDVGPGIRESLNQALETTGLDPLQRELRDRDPEYYKDADIQNPRRVLRALEICRTTGRPYSSYRNQKGEPRNFTPILIGLRASRSILYDRINDRVDQMMTDGLLEEVSGLFDKKHLNALQTVGYKELFHYLEGSASLEEAVEEIKKNTRRFAKRQLTWFRKNEQIHWFDYQTPLQEIISHIEKITQD